MADFFEMGRPLGRRGLFQLVSDEAFRDGKLEPWENEILGRLARFLKLDAELARTIARVSLGKFHSGAFADGRPLDPTRLYREILRHVYSDEEVDEKEKAMLAGMQKLLDLTDDDHQRLLAQVTGAGTTRPAAPSPRVVELVSRAAKLGEPAGPPAADILAGSLEIAAEAASRTDVPEVDRPVWVQVLCSLGGPLGRGGKWKELEGAWTAILTSGPLVEESASVLAPAFAALVDARLDSGALELVPGAVSLAARLARLPPGDPFRWVALGSAGHQAVRLFASARRFALVGKVVRMLDEIPPDAGEAQGHAAEALASWGILAMKASEPTEVEAATDAMTRLAARARFPEVVRAQAQLLGCAVEWWTETVKNPVPATKALAAMHGLVKDHEDDRTAALSFSLCSGFALMLVLILEDFATMKSHLELVRLVSGAHVGDEEMQFAFARGMVNSAILVKGMEKVSPEVQAELLRDLESTLGVLASACPGSAQLGDAKARFERVKAQAPTTPVAEPPPPPIPAPVRATGPAPADVKVMQAAFDRLQAARAPEEAAAAGHAILEIVGRGGYPRRVLQEGESVYSVDEPYFLHLLAELERQLTQDRTRFWRMYASQLELVLRYMIEDATPAIAQTATRLRRLTGLDQA